MTLLEGGSGLHTQAMGMPATTTTCVTEERFVKRRGSASSSSSSSDREYEEDLDANGMPIKKKRGLGAKLKGMFHRKKHTEE